MTQTSTPPGWYADPQNPGQQRYWDGQQWTEHQAAGAPAPYVAQPAAKPNKPIYLRWWAILAAVIVVIALISSISGGGSSGTSNTSGSTGDASAVKPADAKEQKAEKAQPKKKKKKKAAKPRYTVSQGSAILAAKNYLSMGAGFSREGLIEQLSSPAGNDFPKADAVFAVNHVKVDWNGQAVMAAKNYMSLGGFSRSSLIEQLSSPAGNKFTRAQATYAADKVGL